MACDVCLGINPKQCPVCGIQPKKIVCPECGGYGIVNCVAWYMDKFGRELETEVSAAKFVSLPEHMQGEADTCPVCNGCGSVFKDGDEYYPAE